MNTGIVFNIQRFSLHDGPGIRTVVFFKGCPLRCQWCANPESQQFKPEITQFSANCIGCDVCLAACPHNAISRGPESMVIDRALCNGCGTCAQTCYAEALRLMGKKYSVDQVMSEILKDSLFYRNSGGGVTLSGGEPLSQGDFALEVLQRCKALGIHTAIETSGYGPQNLVEEIAPLVDLIFFDIKHSDPIQHRKLTGVSNELIMSNLRLLDGFGKEIIVRTPIIPGCNDDQDNIDHTAEICRELSSVKIWELLPYHQLGEHKFACLGRDYPLHGIIPPSRELMEAIVGRANAILEPANKICRADYTGLRETPATEKSEETIKKCGSPY